jgi:hypothetical protein
MTTGDGSIKHVHKTVFPVAGLGRRFLPATKASPKEMTAVVDKPLIQYAVRRPWRPVLRVADKSRLFRSRESTDIGGVCHRRLPLDDTMDI